MTNCDSISKNKCRVHMGRILSAILPEPYTSMMISVFNERLEFCFVSKCIPPLTPDDILGKTAWHFSGNEAEKVKTLFSRCITLGESARYWAQIEIEGVSWCLYNRIHRFEINGERAVLCVSSVLPPSAYGMSEQEISIVEGLSNGKAQKEIAAELGLTQPAISIKEQAIREKLSIQSRTDWKHLHVLFS